MLNCSLVLFLRSLLAQFITYMYFFLVVFHVNVLLKKKIFRACRFPLKLLTTISSINLIFPFGIFLRVYLCPPRVSNPDTSKYSRSSKKDSHGNYLFPAKTVPCHKPQSIIEIIISNSKTMPGSLYTKTMKTQRSNCFPIH